MTAAAQADAMPFKAEIRQLLNILVHSLYQDQEIFLRELISNASDALTRLHFESLTNATMRDPEAPLEIRVSVVDEGQEDSPKRVIIKDTGVGMTRDELVENLGTIAQSGARAFLKQVEEGQAELNDIIGQFGVGFYSVFMVAEEVRVVSLSYRPEAEAAAWVSSGGDSFYVEPADKTDRGTEIHITLKKTAEEFASEWRLRQIIKKHSDFINYPIYVGEDQANQQTSLWRQSPAGVREDEYEAFYKQMTLDMEKPLATIHFASDAPVNVRALLFIPARREKNILAARREPGVKLYSNNVLIQEYCTDLLPKWLEFVDGVVDSEDLPLNVSRETVQNNRLMRQLGKTLKSRVLRQLREMADKEPEQYEGFWREFSRVLKEGLAMDPTAKEDILPLLRSYSSTGNGALTSLDEYVARMPETQEEIYYVLGDDARSVAYSPHLDPFKARGIEVLYWIDPLDPFLAPLITEYQGKKVKNVDAADLELPEPDDAPEGEAVPALEDKAFNLFVGRCVTTLGDRVAEVRASRVLRDSPVRLVSPEDEPNPEMQRIQRYLSPDYEIPRKILEVNRNHPLIVRLARLVGEKPEAEVINLAIEQLFASALLQEGLLANPAEMLPRIQKLLELAAGGATA